MITLLDIVSFKTALLLKECGFDYGCRLYYHNNFCERSSDIVNDELELRGYETLEMVGDGSFTFYNSKSGWRVGCPYVWQVIIWGILHPIKSSKIWQ